MNVVSVEPTDAPDSAITSYGSSFYSWYAVAVLMIMGLFSYVDRQIIVLLIDPIRRDLGITDVQVSLLTGFAFALLYATCGLPLAWAADRFSRRWIIFLGVSFWGLATMSCGFASSFVQLFLGRVGVGMGEATLFPASYSIASDIFPPKRLAFATAVMATGSLIGIGLSFAVGGLIASAVSHGEMLNLPVFGEVRAWQAAFIAVGLPGPFIGFLMFTIREPRRKGSAKALNLSGGSDKFLGFLKYRRAYFFFYTTGYGLLTTGLYSLMTWGPSYLLRVFEWSGARVGVFFGLSTMFGLGFGMIMGGAIVDRLYRNGMKDAHIRLYALTALLGAPIIVIAIALHDPWIFLAAVFLWNFLINGYSASGIAAMQIITPNEFRARMTAIFLFVSNLVGFGLGPLFVAMLTDYLFKNDKMVGWSIVLLFVVIYPLAILSLLKASKIMREIQSEKDFSKV